MSRHSFDQIRDVIEAVGNVAEVLKLRQNDFHKRAPSVAKNPSICAGFRL